MRLPWDVAVTLIMEARATIKEVAVSVGLAAVRVGLAAVVVLAVAVADKVAVKPLRVNF